MENKIGKLFIAKPKVLKYTGKNTVWFLGRDKWIVPTLMEHCNLQDKIFIFLGTESSYFFDKKIHRFLFGNNIIETYYGKDFLKECIQLD